MLRKYENPVIPGFYPDPSVCRVGEDFYLVTSTFEYFPGVPVFHSRDLVHWRKIGHCLTRKSQLDLTECPPSRGIWAPTIRYHDGTFYMVTTVMDRHGVCRKFLVTTRDIRGEWSEPVWIDQPGIDPSLLFDDDGKVYLTSNGAPTPDGPKGIWQAELDVATGKIGPMRFLWGGISGKYPEGPHLYKIHGFYYLCIAEGGCQYGHMQTIARSRSPWGPFEPCPRNPILTHRDRDHRQPIQGIGHMELFDDAAGNFWAVFLGYRISTQYFYHLGRETFLAPVTFDADGWPIVGDAGTVTAQMSADFPMAEEAAPPPADTIGEGGLGLDWLFLRNPAPGSWSLEKSSGRLTLHGLPGNLNSLQPVSWIGKRLTAFEEEFRVKLDFEPAADNEEAGITAFYFAEHHYEIAIVRRFGVKRLIVRRRIADLSTEVAAIDAPAGIVDLAIRCERETMHFGFYLDGKWVAMASGSTRYLSCEAAKVGFTGVMLAMYATGNGAENRSDAQFLVTRHPSWKEIFTPCGRPFSEEERSGVIRNASNLEFPWRNQQSPAKIVGMGDAVAQHFCRCHTDAVRIDVNGADVLPVELSGQFAGHYCEQSGVVLSLREKFRCRNDF